MDKKITFETVPLSGSVEEYLPLKTIIVNKGKLEPLWNQMVREYHYLGYQNMIGPRIKYLVTYKDIYP